MSLRESGLGGWLSLTTRCHQLSETRAPLSSLLPTPQASRHWPSGRASLCRIADTRVRGRCGGRPPCDARLARHTLIAHLQASTALFFAIPSNYNYHVFQGSRDCNRRHRSSGRLGMSGAARGRHLPGARHHSQANERWLPRASQAWSRNLSGTFGALELLVASN